MKISIITVSYNAENCIERTIKSVISQTYSDYEYIVIDGGSTDRTTDIIKKYNSSISFWISEPDNGIYNAMNKGIKAATGVFCVFMNAGDVFCGNDVLLSVAGELNNSYSIIMGNQYFLTPCGNYSSYGKVWKTAPKGRLYYDSLYHQACFIRRADLIDNPYDESLRLVSDWKEAVILLSIQNKQYKGINLDIDCFFQDGLTYSQITKGQEEREKVLYELFSEEERICFSEKRKKYRRLFNWRRYFDSLCNISLQLIKRIRFIRIIPWIEFLQTTDNNR